MSARRVFLSGEGDHELGGMANAQPYQSREPPGVLVTLLERCTNTPFEVVGARRWKDFVKYRAGGHATAEERTVLGLCNEALDHGAGVAAFLRDEDGDHARIAAVERGLERARTLYPALSVVGAVAVQSLDGWLLAIDGDRNTERLKPSRAKAALDERGRGTTEARVELVREARLEAVPTDAVSLNAFLEAARVALGD